MHRGDTIRRTHHHHVVRARTVGACRARLISLKPDANNKLSAVGTQGLPRLFRGEHYYYTCRACGCSPCGSAAGHEDIGRADGRACHIRVCVGRGFLPGTETQNLGIEAMKGIAGQRREGGKYSGVGRADSINFLI